MSPALLHLRGESAEAIKLLEAWLGEHAPLTEFSFQQETDEWTTVSLGSYSLESLPTEDWVSFGRQVDTLFEAYSTSLCYGEILFIQSGRLVRHLVLDELNQDIQVNIGQFNIERTKPLKSWSDVWGFVDESRWKDVVVQKIVVS